jgi:hypothetical protein
VFTVIPKVLFKAEIIVVYNSDEDYLFKIFDAPAMWLPSALINNFYRQNVFWDVM